MASESFGDVCSATSAVDTIAIWGPFGAGRTSLVKTKSRCRCGAGAFERAGFGGNEVASATRAKCPLWVETRTVADGPSNVRFSELPTKSRQAAPGHKQT